MSRWIYRVALTGLDLAGAATTYHYATESFSTSPTRPTIPNTYLDGRLSQPLLFQRDMFGPGQTRGRVTIPHGLIELDNSDGGLDGLPAAAAFDIQIVQLFRFDSDAADTTEVVVWAGLIESAILSESTLAVTVRDWIYVFDQQFQYNKFVGTNALPNGLQGTANDIKGQPKPVWWGTVFNCTPPCVNTTRSIYQLTDYQISGITWALTVYDKRIALGVGAAVPIASMQAGYTALAFTVNVATDVVTTAAHGYTTADPVSFTTTGGTLPAPLVDTATYFVRVLSATDFTLHPTAADASANTGIVNISSFPAGTVDVAKNRTARGSYDWCFDTAGSYIRLGSPPVGTVTFDGYDGGTTLLGQLVSLIISRIQGRTPIAGYSFVMASTVGYTPNAAVTNQKPGLFITQETTAFEVMQLVAQSYNAAFGVYFPSGGVSALPLVVARIEPATTQTAILTLTDDDLLPGTFRRGPASDQDRGIPSWRANVSYARNGTTMSAVDAPAETQANLAFLANEYRVLQGDKAAVRTQYPASPEVSFPPSVLADSAAATDLATYLITAANGVYSRRRDVISFQIALETVLALSITLPANYGGTTPTLTGINALLMAQSINVNFARFPGPVDMRLIGYKVDIQRGTVELTLWG
jgi:hypothetical protein